MALSNLEKDLGGIYNPAFRFAFTNIMDEPFTSYWDKIPIVVAPHETIEVSSTTPIPGPGMGHALAIKMTGELVDKIIIREAKADREAHKDERYYDSPKGASLGVPGARKVYEDQILRQLAEDEESPAMQSMRKELIKEINNEVQEAPKQPMELPKSVEEFADIKNKTVVAPKKAVRTKKLS